MPKEDDSDKEELSDAMLKEAFQAIYESVSAFDFDSADNVMHELKNYRIPAEEKDLYEKVDTLLTQVDHDGLVELLGKMFG